MPYYRVLMVDAEGQVVDRVEFGAANDHAAEAAVEELEDRRAKSLWRGGRWLRTWAPPRSRSRPSPRQRLS